MKQLLGGFHFRKGCKHFETGHLPGRKALLCYAVEGDVADCDPVGRGLYFTMGKEGAGFANALTLGDLGESSIAVPAKFMTLDTSAQGFEPHCRKGTARVLSRHHSGGFELPQAIRHGMLGTGQDFDTAAAPGADGDRPLIKRGRSDLAYVEMHGHAIRLEDKGLSLRH